MTTSAIKIERQDNTKNGTEYMASLVDGPSIAGVSKTEGEAVDGLVRYMRDMINERNEQLRQVRAAACYDGYVHEATTPS